MPITSTAQGVRMLRKIIASVAALAFAWMFGCVPVSTSDEDQLDWHTSSCSDLGGTTTAAGACFVPCSTDSDCPIDTLYCPKGSSSWSSGQCEVKERSRGCGPAGWNMESYGCYLSCSAPGNDAECP